MTPKGIFVTIDGPHGVGKSTLVHNVAHKLEEEGVIVHVTKEPTASLLGKFAREGENLFDGKSLACLMAADRYFHIDNEILPSLTEGKIVLCDRYVESSLSLQRLDKVEIDYIWEINKYIHMPDLTIILIASPEILAKRLSTRKELHRYEREKDRDKELLYYQEASSFLINKGFNVKIINNESCSINTTTKIIFDHIKKLYEKRNGHRAGILNNK